MPFEKTLMRRRLDAMEKRLQTLADLTAERDERPAAIVVSEAERSALMRFFREVVRGGGDEAEWRARNPKEHALLIRTCGVASSRSGGA